MTGLNPKVSKTVEDVTSVDSPFEESSTQQRANTLERGFKSRHVGMFAIAGAIGTGLLIGSGTGLARGGPASMLIAYAITGFLVLNVMSALGEMAVYMPMDKGFSGYATRLVDPALGSVFLLLSSIEIPADISQLCHRRQLLLQIRRSLGEQLDSCRYYHAVLAPKY